MCLMLAAARALLLPAAPASRSAPRAVAAAHRSRPPAMGMVLTEENAMAVLDDCQRELETVFGTNEQSRRVGITGRLEFVELDGPILVVRLAGRFWHQRARVVERVSSYVLERIPECVDVVIEDAAQLDDADPDPLQAGLDAIFEPPQFGNDV